MTELYEVIFTDEAVQDLAELAAYIAHDRGRDVALSYTDRIDAYCRSLARFPHRGHRRDDLREGLRVVGMDRRLTVQFQVIGLEVVIARLLYGGRQE